LLPRPTYSSSDGVGVHGNATIPLNAKGDMDVNINYEIHSKTGFKPTAKLEKNTSIGQFKFGYSKEESSDNNDHIWATKWPELEYYAPRINFGNSGIYIDSSANWGRWSEDNRKTGGHKEYRAEITHVPISLWSRANLRFFAGYRRDLYSAYDAQRRDPYSGVVLNQGVNDRMWTSFWYKKHNLSGYTPYRFDSIDHPRQKGVSLGYVLTPRDTVIFSFAKNLDNGNVEDRNWTWIRDLHSFTAIVTYKQVDKEWEVKVVAKDFN
jgi:LPS-assembly protein